MELLSAVLLLCASFLLHGVACAVTAADSIESSPLAWNYVVPGRKLSQTDKDWTAIDNLFLGVVNGNIDQVEGALDAGADVNTRNTNNQTPLWGAVAFGNLEISQLLLDRGADPNIADISKFAPLTIAAIQDDVPDQLELLQLLIDNGADLELPGPRSEKRATSLGMVASSGNLEALKILLKAGSNTETKNSDGQTALAMASFFGHTDVVKELIASGAEVDTKDEDGNTPLHFSAQAGNDIVMALLIEADANVNAQNEAAETPLMVAVQWGGDIGTVKSLIDGGADPTIKDDDGLEPLHDAAILGQSEVIGALVDGGGNVNAQTDGEGLTTLHLSVASEKGQAVLELLALGADARLTTTTFLTPLHLAPLNLGSEGIVKTLLAAGSDINAPSGASWTPLHFAAYWGNERVVEFLVEQGASVEAITEDGETPSDLVCKCDDAPMLPDLIGYLESARFCPIGACESPESAQGVSKLLELPTEDAILEDGEILDLASSPETEVIAETGILAPATEAGEDILDFEPGMSPALESLPVFPDNFSSSTGIPKLGNEEEKNGASHVHLAKCIALVIPLIAAMIR